MLGDEPRPTVLRTLSRIVVGVLLVACFLVFILWRTDNPRLERLRMQIVDAVAPGMTQAARPTTGIGRFFRDLQDGRDLRAENTRLREQVDRLRAWRDIAEQLEEENARLRALNRVQLPPRTSFVTAEVIADGAGPYAQSVIVNAGGDDGVRDGAPALDAAGLVGRIVGVGQETARILLLTDPKSRTPVLVGPEQERAILIGDETESPLLEFIFDRSKIAVGARVATSGRGGVFPSGLLIGRVAELTDRGAKVQLAADFRRLDFLRIQRTEALELSVPDGQLIQRSTRQAPTSVVERPDDDD